MKALLKIQKHISEQQYYNTSLAYYDSKYILSCISIGKDGKTKFAVTIFHSFYQPEIAYVVDDLDYFLSSNSVNISYEPQCKFAVVWTDEIILLPNLQSQSESINHSFSKTLSLEPDFISTVKCFEHYIVILLKKGVLRFYDIDKDVYEEVSASFSTHLCFAILPDSLLIAYSGVNGQFEIAHKVPKFTKVVAIQSQEQFANYNEIASFCNDCYTGIMACALDIIDILWLLNPKPGEYKIVNSQRFKISESVSIIPQYSICAHYVASQKNLYFINFRTSKIIDPYNDLSDLNVVVYPISKNTKILAIDELAILHNAQGFFELRQGVENFEEIPDLALASRISGKKLAAMKRELLRCLDEKQSYNNKEDFQEFMGMYHDNSQELYKMYAVKPEWGIYMERKKCSTKSSGRRIKRKEY